MSKPPPDPLYDLTYILWRMLKSLVAELNRWSYKHYGAPFKQGDGDRD
jgi:hypothetical protein